MDETPENGRILYCCFFLLLLQDVTRHLVAMMYGIHTLTDHAHSIRIPQFRLSAHLHLFPLSLFVFEGVTQLVTTWWARLEDGLVGMHG